MTASQLGYSIWKSQLNEIVEINKDIEKYTFIHQATYGGRCHPLVKEFTSNYYEEAVEIHKEMVHKQTEVEKDSKEYKEIEAEYLERGKMLYNTIKKSKNYIFNGDVISLYPASMSGCEMMDVSYPVGFSRWSELPEEEFENNKHGFYKVIVSPPKNIRVPVLPSKPIEKCKDCKFTSHECDNCKIKLGVQWNLEDREQVLTNIDIENAIKFGYKVDFTGKCLVWDKTAKIFDEYIKTFYEMKKQGEITGNSSMRTIAKLFLNSLYGKMLQKAHWDTNKIVKNIEDFYNFVKTYDLNDWNILNNDTLVLSGSLKNDFHREKAINKPTHIGSFILSYSRRLMLNIMEKIDPTLQTPIFNYTDTDSLHISGESYEKLVSLGVVRDDKEKLGYLSNDIDDDALIINEKALGPKCYMYEYINRKGEIKIYHNSTMKCKGIPIKKADNEMEKEKRLTINRK